MSRGLTWLKDGGEQKDLLLIIISALPARLRNQRGRFLSRGGRAAPWRLVLHSKCIDAGDNECWDANHEQRKRRQGGKCALLFRG